MATGEDIAERHRLARQSQGRGEVTLPMLLELGQFDQEANTSASANGTPERLDQETFRVIPVSQATLDAQQPTQGDLPNVSAGRPLDH